MKYLMALVMVVMLSAVAFADTQSVSVADRLDKANIIEGQVTTKDGYGVWTKDGYPVMIKDVEDREVKHEAI